MCSPSALYRSKFIRDLSLTGDNRIFVTYPITCNGFDVDTRCKKILKDVLKLHPEYLTKSGIIESFTVDNHEVYTDTRCFFINKADGTKVDFSVNKCLTNLAESQAHLDVSP